MKIILVGAVLSSARTLAKLIEHQLDIVGVFGYESEQHSVSDYANLESLASDAGIPYFPFRAINDHAAAIAELQPDLAFCVGLSQLISDEIIAVPTHGCVGFHPTHLPLGRGRAPLAWLILDEHSHGAASFFQIGSGTDDGPLFAQRTYSIDPEETVSSVYDKMLGAIDDALDDWLPKLKSGVVEATPQDDSRATYYARRGPEDGLIDWSGDANDIARLIRAATKPYPGAFTHCSDAKIVIWTSAAEITRRHVGVVGRILSVSNSDESPTSSFTVQCGNGLLHVSAFSASSGWIPRVGLKLSYDADIELHRLRSTVTQLEARLSALEKAKN